MIHQKPVSTLGSPLQPNLGPITGNPNQVEKGGQISGEPESGPRRTMNLGPWQAIISNTCITRLIVSIIVLAILFLLTLAFSIFSLVVLMYNGDFLGIILNNHTLNTQELCRIKHWSPPKKQAHS
jgi:hypothetical protein